ncbi:related to pisatin demethylase cytochrome P450 [Rhynchosporium graminicola]|uniref:Related to pisatin demethylase cytochrome P450 n=1 Tax=Rhynchosporium graminicola TaxID=2792576 RepID=A0A1E1LPU5_9HELO|nr:related to pisatin demethylase cytochrome P450 [Rhynchosporium commune]
MEEATPSTHIMLATAALLGVVAHLLLFNRIEVDTHPLLLLTTFCLSPVALQYTLSTTRLLSVLLTTIFTATLFISIAIYRQFFHPLRSFPGRRLAKLTQLHSLTLTARSGLKWHQVVQSLHSQYGDYVRTGPRELSIADPAAMRYILGYGAKPGKGPVYDSMEESVNTTRDRDFHTRRRKVWDSSLKTLVSTYKPQIEGFTSTFLTRIRSSLNSPFTINDVTIYYSYDVTTQLAFGQAGGFMSGTQSDTAKSVMAGLKEATFALGLLYHVPWIMTLLTTFAFLPGPLKVWNDWSEKMLQERKNRGTEKPDLMQYLIANTPDTKKGNNLLFADSRVIVAAGSDTTATALTTIFTILASSPTLVSQLRAEIDLRLTSNPSMFSCATSSPVLDSIINETLRLYPPTLFASQRTNLDIPLLIPSRLHTKSLSQEGTYIPRDTILSMPTYTLHRDARNFSRPTEFIPERWTTRPDLVLNRQAFIPFSTGMTNCPGKNLAMMELRDVVARTISEFDICLAESVVRDFDMEIFMKGTRDCFMATVPNIDVVFSARVHSSE